MAEEKYKCDKHRFRYVETARQETFDSRLVDGSVRSTGRRTDDILWAIMKCIDCRKVIKRRILED